MCVTWPVCPGSPGDRHIAVSRCHHGANLVREAVESNWGELEIGRNTSCTPVAQGGVTLGTPPGGGRVWGWQLWGDPKPC